jgi:hypothetical protein
MPTLIWPAWAIRLIPTDRLADTAVTSIRAGLAATVLIPSTRLTLRNAVDMLGGLITPASAKSALNRLSEQQRTATLAILTNLAHVLDAEPGPIDYTRRRALFTTPTVDMHAYATLAATRGWSPPSPLQLRLLDQHLTVTLTGTPGHTTNPIRGHSPDVWNPLILALPPPVRAFVHDQARRLLDEHGIDEPVTWQPPAPAGIRWPGIDPDTINPDRFADAFTTHHIARDGLQLICHATGRSGVQVRLYTLIVDQTMSEQQWNTLAEHPDPDILAPATLRHLYHDQGLSMMDIARRARTTEQAVRDALTAAGTTVFGQRRHTRPVSKPWLQQHYLGTGKTIGQASTEAGVSRNTFTKYARIHNIPTTEHARTVNRFANWPTHQQPPDNVKAAFCCARHAIQYVREVLAMPGHRTQRAAAAALGLHEVVLMRHRQHIEQAARIRIFQPGQPLTPTPEGAKFLGQAALALHQLDLANSARS